MSAPGRDPDGLPVGRDLCPATVLRDLSVQHRAIGDFRPVPDSLEWRLAQACWIARGRLTGFIDDSVPWAVNNDGRLSADAAAVLLANCRESPPGLDGFTLLELVPSSQGI